MTYNPNIHHRRSIRLRNFNYSSEGAYFVTICAQGRECLFGEVVDGMMLVNDAGRIVESVWSGLPERFPILELDACVIMPNHVHFILAPPGDKTTQKEGRGKPRPYPVRGCGGFQIYFRN